MVRMEIACFIVIAFMSAIYFSSKRENTKLHKTFSIFLIVSMIHLIFDGITIYTVNHMDIVSSWFNDISHRIFISTMVVIFYLGYRYIATLIEEDTGKDSHSFTASTIILTVSFAGTLFLPLIYVETPQGNYSYGPAVFTLYISVATYLIMVFIVLCKYWKQINAKKKKVIGIAMASELFVLIYQSIYPTALISGMGLMLISLSFYLTMENPDILLVKQVQEEKQKAEEANAAKSLFLSHMSHEIRTPMNAVVGMTEILLRTPLTEEQHDYLINIKSSGNALVSIINDILDISKIEAGKMELINEVYEIRSLLDEIHMIILNRIGEKPVELIYEIDETLPRALFGDGLRLRQIIINLLNNAVKFTDTGHVKLIVKVESQTNETCLVHIAVEDTGQGIKEEDFQRLFAAFEQVNTSQNRGKVGTGLGLTISNQLIGMMNGKLELQSEYGVGSRFFFTIPQQIVSEDLLAKEDAENDSMNFMAPEAKILIVDDNEMNCKVALGLLSPFQMQMDTADNGKTALEMIQQKEYHIVFMDHMMPIMDGIEATEALRKMDGNYYKNVPVIALTANAMKESEKLFYQAGMNGFIAKPIDIREMCKVIKKYLPEHLLIKTEYISDNNVEIANLPVIEGIDSAAGVRYSGSTELFISLLSDFYKVIDAKTDKINEYIADNAIRAYTIEVHALKSAAKMIGATELSEQFLHLEQLGNANDVEAIKTETPKVLENYQCYKDYLKQFAPTTPSDLHSATADEIINILKRIQSAIEDFDIDATDSAMKELEKCKLPEDCLPLFEKLCPLVVDLAQEDVLKVTSEMIERLSD